MSWACIGLGERVSDSDLLSVYDIFLKKYGSFTQIQKDAIPVISGGSNCLLIAPTGSGKTEAAVLPVLNSIIESREKIGIVALYITPLRALNRDMIKRLSEICNRVGITISVRHGDTLRKDRSVQEKTPPQILITTPETLQSILPTKKLGTALKNVKFVIIDEIHELYYNKRGAQLSVGLERLKDMAGDFQRIGISATIGNSEVVSKFLGGSRKCEIVAIDARKQMHLKVYLPEKQKVKLNDIEEKFGLDEEAMARLETIASLVKKSKSTLIFANTRQIVEALGSRLVYLNSVREFGGISVHHSSLDKDERIRVENDFKSGKVKSIIATSSLELGIDVGKIDLVVQYGSPRQALRLVQRVGRSGHSAGKVSNGAIIATNNADALEALSICDNVNSGNIEEFDVENNALDVLVNQLAGIALEKGECKIEAAYEILTRAYPYRDLKMETFSEAVEFMNKNHLLRYSEGVIRGTGGTRLYYYKHLSVLPDSKRFVVKSVVNNRILSTLDENFVINNIDEGSVFITKGLPWKVISIDEGTITIEPSTDLEAAVPDWVGEDIPVSKQVADAFMRNLENFGPVESRGFMDPEAFSMLKDFVSEVSSIYEIKSGEIAIEEYDDYKVAYTFLGTLANEALSRLLGYLIGTEVGDSVNIKSSPYMIFFEARKNFDLEKVLRSISAQNVYKLLAEAIRDTDLFRYKFIGIAKLFGIVEKDASVSKSLARQLMRIFRNTLVYRETEREILDNYLDVGGLINFFEQIGSGALKIKRIRLQKLSRLTNAILKSAYYTKELIMPLLPSDELLNSFVKYITSKSIGLVCTYCGFTFKRAADELEGMKFIECPSCRSTMIATDQEGYSELCYLKRVNKKLNSAQKKKLREMMSEAGLINAYGWRGVAALSTYGIGPRTAARALRMLRGEERLFYMDLIEAQRQFIKNKKYWTI